MTLIDTTSAPPKLHMIWPRRRRVAPAVPAVPAGYTMRAYREGDKDSYIRLMQRSGFETWDERKALRVFATMFPNGLFFVVHNASGALVATTAAQANPREHHPDGAELGWVGTDPDHRGKGLGYITCAVVTRMLHESRYPTLYLMTDTFRLPAVHIYLKLGWIPFLDLPDSEAAWRTVCADLGIAYESIETTLTPDGA